MWFPFYSSAESCSFPVISKMSLPQTVLLSDFFFKKIMYLLKFKTTFSSIFSETLHVSVDQPPTSGWSHTFSRVWYSLVTLKRPSRYVYSFQYLRPDHLSVLGVSRLVYKWSGNSERIYNSPLWVTSDIGSGHMNWPSYPIPYVLSL